MLGYWRWLYKILRIVGKTNFAKIMYRLGFDFTIILGAAYILAAKINAPVAIIVALIGFILLIGHMLYLMVEVY